MIDYTLATYPTSWSSYLGRNVVSKRLLVRITYPFPKVYLELARSRMRRAMMGAYNCGCHPKLHTEEVGGGGDDRGPPQ